MSKEKKYEFQAGIFIIACLSLFVASIWVLGRDRQIFGDQEAFYISFTDVKGLSKGAPVRLGGIKIGRIDAINISDDLKDTKVHVRALINEEYIARIRADSIANIETQGLLGDRYLRISFGSKGKILPPGSEIAAQESADVAEILDRAGEVIDNTVKISTNVKKFTDDFNDDILNNFKKAVSSIAKISDAIESGDGLISKLVFSSKDGDSILADIKNTSQGISKVIEDVKEGNGLLNSLIYDPKGGDVSAELGRASKKIGEASEALAQVLNGVIEGNGLLHAMIYSDSPEGVDDILKKLNKTISNLEEASEALSKGTGTIGALLLDPQLYDNLVEVTDNAKRSFLLRQAIKNSLEN